MLLEPSILHERCATDMTRLMIEYPSTYKALVCGAYSSNTLSGTTSLVSKRTNLSQSSTCDTDNESDRSNPPSPKAEVTTPSAAPRPTNASTAVDARPISPPNMGRQKSERQSHLGVRRSRSPGLSIAIEGSALDYRSGDPLSTLSEAAGDDSKSVGSHIGLTLSPMHLVKSNLTPGGFEAYTSDDATNSCDATDFELALNLKCITPVGGQARRPTTVTEAQRNHLVERLRCGEGLAEPRSPVTPGAASVFLGFVHTINGNGSDSVVAKPGRKGKKVGVMARKVSPKGTNKRSRPNSLDERTPSAAKKGGVAASKRRRK